MGVTGVQTCALPICLAGETGVEVVEEPAGVQPELEEALGRRAAVDPAGVAEAVDHAGLGIAPGGEPEREQLVEERPEEDPPDGDAQDAPDARAGGTERKRGV